MRPGTSTEFIFCWLSTATIPWTIVCFSSEMPLEETKFSFSRDYQLDIASRLEMRAPASVSQMLRLWACQSSWPRWWFQMTMRLEKARRGRRLWGSGSRLKQAVGSSSDLPLRCLWSQLSVEGSRGSESWPLKHFGNLFRHGVSGTGQFSLAHENGPGLILPWELLLALHDVPGRLSLLSSYKDNCKWEVI